MRTEFNHKPSPAYLAAVAALAKLPRNASCACSTSYAAENRNVSANPSVTYAPSVFAKDIRSGNVSKRDLETAMNALFGKGTIINEQFGSASHTRNRKP